MCLTKITIKMTIYGIISERIMSTSHFTEIEKKLKVILKPTVKLILKRFVCRLKL